MPPSATRDRRVERTERLLREALASLLHEKPYPEIVVKEILSRADIGRSTFYTHFRDKDELLASCIREMLPPLHAASGSTTAAKLHERILSFSGPLFEHVDGHRRAMRSPMGAESSRVMHEHLERTVAEHVEAELRAALPVDRAGGPPLDLVARRVATTFVLVLNWWLEGDGAGTPGKADRAFRRLVEPPLAQLFGA
jgi:AcrR family transcriptional regulator